MATVVEPPKLVFTQVGIDAANAAGTAGPVVNINKFRLGSTAGYTPTRSQTDLRSVVFQGGSDKMRYRVLQDGFVQYVIRLDETVGDFAIGEIALQLDDGTPFCIAVNSTPEPKTAARPASDKVGDFREYDIRIRLDTISATAQFTILYDNEFAFPEVDTPANLPPVAVATSQCYLIRRVPGHEKAAVAFSINGKWNYRYLGRTFFSEDDIRGPTIQAANWTAAATPGRAVYLNRDQNKFLPASRASKASRPMGVRGLSNELVWCGAKFATEDNRFSPGTFYYVGFNGELTPDAPKNEAGVIDEGFLVGYALASNWLLVLAGTSFALPHATERDPGIVRLATEQEVIQGTRIDIAVSPKYVSRALNVRQATETRMGIAEIATLQEVQEGVNDEWFVTPLKLQRKIDGLIPPGTKMVFVQNTVPAGWRLVTNAHDRMLRVVNQAAQGGQQSGSWMVSGVNVEVLGHALTEAQLPAHDHDLPRAYFRHREGRGSKNLWSTAQPLRKAEEFFRTNNAGGGQAHAHGTRVTSEGDWRPAYQNVLVCERLAS